MFGRRRPQESKAAQCDVVLPQSPCGRKAYLQRLGIGAAAGIAKPAGELLLAAAATGAAVQNEVRQKYLRKLAYSKKIVQRSKSLLETAIAAGHTYIITNAMSGWVEYSATRWAPELLPVLRRVRVISARDKFEATFPDDVWQWKIQAFLEVQRQMDATPITNLVALGDADYEIEAARIMGDEFEEGVVKTVKFRPHPNPEEHLKQLEVVDKNLEKVVGSARSFRVVLARRQQ